MSLEDRWATAAVSIGCAFESACHIYSCIRACQRTFVFEFRTDIYMYSELIHNNICSRCHRNLPFLVLVALAVSRRAMVSGTDSTSRCGARDEAQCPQATIAFQSARHDPRSTESCDCAGVMGIASDRILGTILVLQCLFDGDV
jgi:hypothetical protein